MPIQTFTVPADVTPQALETFVGAVLGVDRLDVRQWARDGRVLVDGVPGKASRYVKPGEAIAVDVPPPRPHEAEPQDLALPIRYADDQLVVVAKPAGMATHPGPGWWKGSCVNGLLHAVADWPGVGGVAGPGIVHRLDRDTSGLLVFAKTDPAHQALLADAAAHRLGREYLAWVAGEPAESGTVDAPLARDPDAPQLMAVRADGKEARTHWSVLARGPGRSLLRVTLETGRNHQIRVHMAHLGHPVMGDPVYGPPQPDGTGAAGAAEAAGMALHAWQLAFDHPVTGDRLSFTEPPPDAWTVWGETRLPG